MREGDPRRPGIPVLLPCAGCCWASTALFYSALAGSEGDLASMLAACSLAMSTVGLALTIRAKHPRQFSVAMFIGIGMLLGTTAASTFNDALENVPSDHEWELTLSSDPRRTDFGYSVDAEGVSDNGSHANVRLYLEEADGLYNRAKIFAKATLKAIDREDAYKYLSSGISATANVSSYDMAKLDPFSQFVYDMRAASISSFAEHARDQAGILQALVCGYRPTINQDGTYDEFKACGLAHVVAVSGAHLAIVTMAFGLLLRLIGAGRVANAVISSIFVVAYLLFAGIPISAVRAAIMVILSIASGIFKRRSASLGSLSLCIIFFLATDPICAVSTSLILSAGSTFGIVIFAKLMSSWFSELPKAIRRAIGDPLALTLSSNVVTLPYSVSTFGMLPLISPIANVIATPLFSLACVVGLVAAIAACIDGYVGSVLIAIASACAWPLSASVHLLSSIRGGCIPMEAPLAPMIALTIIACALLWCAWPQPKLHIPAIASALAIIAIALLAGKMPGPQAQDKIVMLDVGQGDSFLIQSNGASVLIDTGNQDLKLASSLMGCGIGKLDALLITHPDDDHCGSMEAASRQADVRRICVPSSMLDCACGKCESVVSRAASIVGKGDVTGLDVGATLSVGSFELRVVWPSEYEDDGGNSDSLCLLASIDCDGDGVADWKALFTGDAESDQLEQIVDREGISDIDILKVGHHGSKASLSERALSSLTPEYALISVGDSNRYGHPSKEALSLLDGFGVEVLRTDERGTATLSFSKTAITIE